MNLGKDEPVTDPSGVGSRLNMELEFGLKDDGGGDDDDSYDEQQELANLVAASAQNRRRQTQSPAQASLQARARNEPSLLRRLFGTRKSLRLIVAIAAVFGLFYLLAPSRKTARAHMRADVHYQCPKKVKANTNVLATEDELEVDKGLDVWINTFRPREYDRWGHTYNDVKTSMTNWKAKMYAPYLRQNSTIYDVTAGVGLDTLMTLEILKETSGLSGLTVYGNDMKKENVDTAHSVFEKLLASVNGKMGIFCPADSTLLHEFVPSDSFDLVFSGRIPPLANPLGYRGRAADLDRQYSTLCSIKLGRRDTTKLQLFNTLQEDWYLKWVLEMLRIAKPGSPVIVEHVSLPLCQNEFDFGGVPMSFWNSTPSIVSSIKPNSLKIQTDKLVKERYHVFMQKEKTKLET